MTEKPKLKKMRLKSGYTLSQLSEISGIPLGTIQSLDCGHRATDGTRIEMLCRLALALDCSPIDLIDDKHTANIVRYAFGLTE